MTPREIREMATDYGWLPGKPAPEVIEWFVKFTGLQPFAIRRALSRSDKRTPKSSGGPAVKPVYFRLNTAQEKKALKLAKKAGYETVSGWCKALVEREMGE